MDIKKALMDIVNSESNIRYASLAAEKLVEVMLTDYLKKQNKAYETSKMTPQMLFDAWLPDGIDDIEGGVALEIKIARNGHFFINRLYDIIGRIALGGASIDSLLVVVIGEVPPYAVERFCDKEHQLNFNVRIWGIDKLVEIFQQNEELFAETYMNLSKTLMQDTITSGISRNDETHRAKKQEYLKQLNAEYKKDNIVLFLGAGAAKDANIAMWDALISELYVALVDKQLRERHILMDQESKEKLAKEIIEQNGNSPLLQTRFLRKGFEDGFEELVGEILYRNAKESSPLLEELGQLCIPNRGKLGIRAIVNYNFDDLVEKNLRRMRVKYRSIYSEGVVPMSEELGIYHVHGFIPQDKESYSKLTESLLVFSEEGYHKLMLEPYNWANIVQLNYMTNNTCVFIGLSMTDPNMRRLLEIAAQKRPDDELCRHYAIMRRFKIGDSQEKDTVKSFEGVNESLQESFFAELGINIIWVDEYSEIPKILQRIKD